MRIILGLIIGSFLIVALPVSALTYGDSGIKPALPRADEPRSNDIFIYTLPPESTLGDLLAIYNYSDDEKTYFLYPADSTPSTDGGYACEQLSQERDGVGGWIAFGPAGTYEEGVAYIQTLEDEGRFEESLPLSLEIPPQSDRFLPFRITVPQQVGVGEQNGCILIQEDQSDLPKAESGINLTTRSGLRVLITVPGEINRQLSINGFQIITRDDGSIIFHPMVNNSGNVSIDTTISIVVYDIFGRVVQEYRGDYNILSNQLTEWNFDFPKRFWGGIFRVEFDITYLDNDGVEQTLHYDSAYFFSMPSNEALIIYGSGLILLIALGTFMIIWRKRKKWIAKEWQAVTLKDKTTIQDLAKEYDVSWKILAKANKLKAPYALNDVNTLRVPPKKDKPKKDTLKKSTPADAPHPPIKKGTTKSLMVVPRQELKKTEKQTPADTTGENPDNDASQDKNEEK